MKKFYILLLLVGAATALFWGFYAPARYRLAETNDLYYLGPLSITPNGATFRISGGEIEDYAQSEEGLPFADPIWENRTDPTQHATYAERMRHAVTSIRYTPHARKPFRIVGWMGLALCGCLATCGLLASSVSLRRTIGALCLLALSALWFGHSLRWNPRVETHHFSGEIWLTPERWFTIQGNILTPVSEGRSIVVPPKILLTENLLSGGFSVLIFLSGVWLIAGKLKKAATL